MGNFDVKLLKRSIGQKRVHQSVKPLYGDHSWTDDLDIVNELGGHTGCVNALSWSSGGGLLASGSDDTYLNIWSYNPADSAKPFTLNTSVSTGHHANIFSVKFMPHSNDSTVVTCAGDSQVRVFDVEYSGSQAQDLDSTRSRRFQTFFPNCRWLSEVNTNARVYRSHADRAKRIVTESSPFYFLSCSEDGEVRQWDLRQPSSAYPPQRGTRSAYRRVVDPGDDADGVPPALISYKNYGLDLNTISCSKHQPYYIALGGAHLHCFLHDRRMLGRNLDAERGAPTKSKPVAGTPEDDAMREATRCVKRFAPNGKRKMRPGDRGHITACKISDARPNELISSWSGDHVYSFDIVKGPDAREIEQQDDLQHHRATLTERAERKRKRGQPTESSASTGENRHAARRLRKVADSQEETGRTALSAQLEGIQTSSLTGESVDTSDLLALAEQQSQRIAKALTRLRKTLFDFSSVLNESERVPQASTDLTEHTAAYGKVLGQACVLLPEMEEVMTGWTYPNTTDPDEILLQNTLRRNRQSSWRFVQAAGCIAKTLGGKLQTLSQENDPRLQKFDKIMPAPMEGTRIDEESRFCYDFIKAITLWLDQGNPGVLSGFTHPNGPSEQHQRFPFDEDVDLENLSNRLRDYLMPLASDERPLFDLEANRFERDELRRLFADQKTAVQAFVRALDSIHELRLNQGQSDLVQESQSGLKRRIMDKGAAARYWGEKVCRALLMDAAGPVNYNYVNRAFGGLEVHISRDDDAMEDLLEIIEEADATEESVTATPAPAITITDMAADEDEDDGDAVDDSEQDGSEGDSDADETDPLQHIYRRRRGPFEGGAYGQRKAFVNKDVAYSSHTKAFKGHCNTRTVKDVNYYGLDDEYVVSGSDDGHLFIWDRKTTEIVSVLEGDGEVVNVVQGHPYEPMIACSGIDSTIKIFGPSGDNRERQNARKGIHIANPGGGRSSSLPNLARATRRRRTTDDDDESDSDTEAEQAAPAAERADDSDEVVQGGLRSRKVPKEKIYEITSQNNADRQRGMGGDAFLTQGMLARLVLAAQNGELQGIEGIGGQGFAGGGGTIVVDENCQIM